MVVPAFSSRGPVGQCPDDLHLVGQQSTHPVRALDGLAFLHQQSLVTSYKAVMLAEKLHLQNSVVRYATDQEPCFKLHIPQTARQANAPIYV